MAVAHNGRQDTSAHVPTDLSAALIKQAVQSEGLGYVRSRRGTEKDLRKAAGTAIAEYLNATVAERGGQQEKEDGVASSFEHFLRWQPAQSRKCPHNCRRCAGS